MKFSKNLEYPFLAQFSREGSNCGTVVAFIAWNIGVIVKHPDDRIGDIYDNWHMEKFEVLNFGVPNTCGVEGYIKTCDFEEKLRLSKLLEAEIYSTNKWSGLKKDEIGIIPFVDGAVIFKDNKLVAELGKVRWKKTYQDKIEAYTQRSYDYFINQKYTYARQVEKWGKENLEDC